jgi:hypothetical protein
VMVQRGRGDGKNSQHRRQQQSSDEPHRLQVPSECTARQNESKTFSSIQRREKVGQASSLSIEGRDNQVRAATASADGDGCPTLRDKRNLAL